MDLIHAVEVFLRGFCAIIENLHDAGEQVFARRKSKLSVRWSAEKPCRTTISKARQPPSITMPSAANFSVTACAAFLTISLLSLIGQKGTSSCICSANSAWRSASLSVAGWLYGVFSGSSRGLPSW